MAQKYHNSWDRLYLFPLSLGGYDANRMAWSDPAAFAFDVYECFHSIVKAYAVAINVKKPTPEYL